MKMISVLVVLAASSVFAQAKLPKQKVDFTSIVLTCDVFRPEVDYVPARTRAVFPNLIKIRGSFADKLASSTDNVR